MALQSLTFTLGGLWMPRHEISEFCWCRPRVRECEGGWLHLHRQLPLTTSHTEVATASLLEGPPV